MVSEQQIRDEVAVLAQAKCQWLIASIVGWQAASLLILGLIALLASRHERLAGWLLILIALAILFEYNELMGHRGAFFVLQAGSIISGPPLIAGSLFLVAAQKRAPSDT